MTYREALKSFTNISKQAATNNIKNEYVEQKKDDVLNIADNKANTAVNATNTAAVNRAPAKNTCHQLPGTVLRISVPAGTVINIFNLIEVASPGGICVVVRLPLLGTFAAGFRNPTLLGIMEAIRAAGGTVEIVS